MRSARTPGIPRGILALLAVLGALVAYQWMHRDDGSARRRAGGISPTPTAARVERESGTVVPSPMGASTTAPDRGPTGAMPTTTRPPTAPFSTATVPPSGTSPSPRATLPVFDLASIPHAPTVPPQEDEERFPTNEWFTREDQRHPERYFELAQRMPELNRPEERRLTLEYFLAFRRQLERDLEAARTDSDEQREILATISRYDAAIARLRPLVEAPPPAGNVDRTD
jgi:hypothetical protein